MIVNIQRYRLQFPLPLGLVVAVPLEQVLDCPEEELVQSLVQQWEAVLKPHLPFVKELLVFLQQHREDPSLLQASASKQFAPNAESGAQTELPRFA